MRVYDCAGILVATELVLSAPEVHDVPATSAAVTLVMGESRPTRFERPNDDVVAELVEEGFPRYTFCRQDGGYVCRIMSVADFVIDADLTRVVCHPVPDGRNEVIPIIVTGSLVAFLLAVSGRCVLHGSAVERGGRALAFVGLSGQGKSTMAALFCAAGARLVTDDVLPLEFGDGPDGGDAVFCLRAGHEVRLRPKASSLAEHFDPGSVRTTADDRRAVAATASELERIPLVAVVLPNPSRDRPDVGARFLGVGDASLALARFQRIEGWLDRDQLRRQFADVGRIVADVPVIEVSVPWGPPFADDLADQVLRACGLTPELSRTPH